MLFNKKSYSVVFLIFMVTTIVFSISYRVYTSRLNKSGKEIADNVDFSERYTSLTRSSEAIKPDTTIILKLKIRNSDRQYVVNTYKAGELKMTSEDRVTLADVENHFGKSNYVLDTYKDNIVILVKESKVEPDKYYLGPTKEGYLAVFKCDKEGNLYIEDKMNDVSRKKVDSLKAADREFINNFDYSFNSRDEALDELAAICS